MKSIILIEDDDAIRDAMEIAFSQPHWHFTGLPSPEPLFEMQLSAPDLFILDGNIGETDGLKLCKFLKDSLLYGNVPIIMISASRDVIRDAIEAGANGALDKPFALKALKQLIALQFDKTMLDPANQQ
ncbi:MAG: response regulator transcription factor [Chitinophagaceae bacterium]|nr:response regulator transcription factor [Chitinophagaceae bacterium]